VKKSIDRTASKPSEQPAKGVDWGESEGDVTAIREDNRWVIDDYIAMYENDELRHLSEGYSECKDGRWVGEPVY
jgi:hypothetical protein